METDSYVFFYSHRPNSLGVHIFSQWFPCKFVDTFTIDDLPREIVFTNAEQYMMARKANLFGDEYYLRKIIDATDPGKIKQFGRKIRNFDPDVWNKHKFRIVVEGNRLKFEQNPTLMKRLQKTGNKIIVEASPHDKIWGIGLKASDAVKIPERNWPGQNLLGKALMKVRSNFFEN